MPNVDNRVVKMTFDNAEFERRVSQTIASLKRLEGATQFKGARRGFSDLDAAAKKVNLNPLADKAKDVDRSFKFTGAQKGIADIGLNAKKVTLSPLVDKASEVDRAFQFRGAQNGLGELGRAAGQVRMDPIIEGASDAGSGISSMATVAVSSLLGIAAAATTVGGILAAKIAGGPIRDGFNEMETNMNSIQTILSNTASKGTSLDQVNDALQQLNTYSDQTIYNFGQMAKNIGTFTAAGVDLQTSVNSIKGIANLAAMSGSSSDQASTAMYQLSQALAAGKVSLMDWNSVVNAGMGGEVFKTALFETGKAMKTIAGVPMEQSFTEWEDAGNSFRESLQDEWINEDVLTTTLEAFSGDLTSVQLQARGFTKEQADNMVELGKQGKEAATSVKTLTQLLGTVKEAIGTGWADTFKIIIGNFDEAKKLFTNMNNFIGGFISRSADARNQLLLDWKNAGGRFLLLLGFKNVVQTVLAVIDPIRKAFREFFPKRTGDDLIKLTQTFYRFTEAIKPSEKTITNISRVFRGFFGVLKVAWIILSETVKFLFDLGRAIFGLIAGPNLAGLASLGNTIGNLTASLINGDKIAGFFDFLRGGLERVVGFLAKFRDAIGDLFSKFDFSAADTVDTVTGRVGQRVSMLGRLFARIAEILGGVWEPLKSWVTTVGQILGNVFGAFMDFFGELGSRIGDALGKGDFDAALDAVNTGLLGGLVLILARFAKNGFKFDFDFGGGLFAALKKSVIPVFEELTGTLKAMQLQIKAEAIMKIAKALAVLVAALFVLSLMDSDELTRSLVGVGIGMGALVGAMFALTKMEFDTKKAFQINAMVFAMNGMATALVALGIATAIFGNMDTATLAQGLITITGLLAAMVIVAKQMSDHTGDFIASAIGIGIMAAALFALSGVILLLGRQDPATLAKGFLGMAGSLLVLTVAIKALPKKEDAAKAGIGMLFLGYAIKRMAEAMLLFGSLSFSEIAKGLLTLAVMMNILVRSVNAMPVAQMIEVGLGVLAIAASMLIMSKAMQAFGSMSLEEIGRGMLALAGTMLIMAIAVNAMSGAAVGAASLLVVAGALLILAGVLQVFAAMSFGELGMALLGVAAALTVIAVAASIITATGAVVAILALGVALIALGAGMVLVGGGVYLLAKGLEILADVGSKGIKGFGELIMSLKKYIPEIVALVRDFIIQMAMGVLSGLPKIIGMIATVGDALLDALIKLIPKAVKAISVLIGALIEHMKVMAPNFIELGFIIIVNLLKGLDENIEEIVNRGVDIMKKFLGALAERAPELATMGAFLLIRFIQGITQNIASIVEAVLVLITTFLNAVASNIHMVVAAGLNIITQLLIGIGQGAILIVGVVTRLILQFISALNMSALLIIAAGTQLILNLIAGVSASMTMITQAVGGLVLTFIAGLGAQAQQIIDAGGNLIINIITGIGKKANDVITAAVETAGKFLEGLVDNVVDFGKHVGNFIHEILQAMRHWVDDNSSSIRTDMLHVAGAILNGLTGGIASKAGKVVKAAMEELASHMPGWMKKILGIDSPSKVFAVIGGQVVDGLAVGLNDRRPAELAVNALSNTVSDAMRSALDILGSTEEFNPTITPVLDLTRVQAEAGKISGFMGSPSLTPNVSSGQARVISTSLSRQNGSVSEASVPNIHEGPMFQQIINAPTALTPAEIYKQTRNQITIAKEKLEIP